MMKNWKATVYHKSIACQLFTITDFRKHYATDEACLDKIFTLRYGKLEACPDCQCVTSFRRITTRRCYQCTECYSQFYPTAGTVFEKTRTAVIGLVG